MDLSHFKTLPLSESDRASLVQERDRRGLTQQQVADALSAHRVTVAKVEKGMQQPSPDLLVRWCELLGLDLQLSLKLAVKKSRRKFS